MPVPSPEVTEALDALREGDVSARDRLMQAVYQELRMLAHAQRRRERSDLTLNTTALVHEAYFKLLGPNRPGFDDRGHFFSAAARAMRQVLVDHARSRSRKKRGGGQRPVALDAVGPLPDEDTDARQAAELLDLDAALTQLAELDPRQAQVVECRYFGGLSVEETAEALSLSESTVKREWRSARAWLYAALHNPDTPS